MLGTCVRRLSIRLSARCALCEIKSFGSRRTLFSQSSPMFHPEVCPAWPSEHFQLLSTEEKAGPGEDALFDRQVEDVKKWWASPRYEGIKRPYSPEDVVIKRGSLQQIYPSSLMARKLFNLLKTRALLGKPIHTSA